MAPRNMLCSVYWQKLQDPKDRILVAYTSAYESLAELYLWIDNVLIDNVLSCPVGYAPLVVYPDV